MYQVLCWALAWASELGLAWKRFSQARGFALLEQSAPFEALFGTANVLWFGPSFWGNHSQMLLLQQSVSEAIFASELSCPIPSGARLKLWFEAC